MNDSRIEDLNTSKIGKNRFRFSYIGEYEGHYNIILR